MARRKSRSRLSRREGKRYARQTAVFTFLTIILLLALLFWGIPALIKVAIFLGDIRSTNQPITGKDEIPPAVPIIQPLPDATNSAMVRIDGFAEDGATVLVNINGVDTHEAVVESDGEFLFRSVKLAQGENTIKIRAIDAASNESKSSSPIVVTFDNQAPDLKIDSPADGAKLFGSQESNITISGSTEPGSQVTVNGSFVFLNQKGSFKSSLQMSSGENTITIIAKDRAGNESSKTITVNYEE